MALRGEVLASEETVPLELVSPVPRRRIPGPLSAHPLLTYSLPLIAVERHCKATSPGRQRG